MLEHRVTPKGRPFYRVLFICKGHHHIAGAQLYLKQIAPLFPPSNYELHYAFHKGDGVRVFEEIGQHRKIYPWQYDWRHLTFRESLFKGIKLFKQISPDLVIFNSSEDKVLAPVWASFKAGIKRRVMVVHWAQSVNDLPIFRSKPNFPFPMPSRYSIRTRLLRSLTFNSLTRIIFVNKMTREAYIKLYRISRSRSITIYNGVDLGSFSNLDYLRDQARKGLGASDDDVIVFAAGNLTVVKGYEYLIKAIYLLVRKGLSVKCFIAGQGELKSQLELLVRKLGIEKSVSLLGYRSDIPLLLAASDIFCMPSINEALGYSLLEAMAAGIPVVASHVGGIPEVVSNGKEGILIPPRDANSLAEAIKQLVSNRELRTRMGKNGRMRVEKKFTLEKMLSETAQVLMNELS